MTLKEQIDLDFKEAYKTRDMAKKNFLAVLKGAIQTQEGNQIPSTDENVLKVIKKFEKNLNELIAAKTSVNTNQNIDQETQELTYLKPYIPQALSEDEIRIIVAEITSRPDINLNTGFLIGVFNKENKGKNFDNKTVSKIIAETVSK